MVKKILLALILTPILLFEAFLGFQTFWGEKILPKVKAGNISLSGLTQTQAVEKLEATVTSVKADIIKVAAQNKVFEMPTKDVGLEFDVEKAAQSAYSVGHSTNLWQSFTQTLSQIKSPKVLQIEFLANEAKLDEFLAKIAAEVETPIVESKLEVTAGKIKFTPGAAGKKIEGKLLKKQILENFAKLKLEPQTLNLVTSQPEIPESLGQKAITSAEKFVGKKLELITSDQTFEITENLLLTLISPNYNLENFDMVGNKEKIAAFVKHNLDAKISKEPVDAKFQFDGKRVVAFIPSSDGVKLDISKTTELIYQALENPQAFQKINLPVSISPAKVKTSDVNNLGISELIGRGVSNFAGSAAERVHNIKLAASRINGTLVAPGDIFSFNQTVGEISTATGYTSAYIISKGRTILGEGGGVCQVSTTAFRAAVNAGLEIVKRVAHAYRVRYYEQGGGKVGLDATIFIPSVDLQFRNDTANNILIQAYTKGVELYFDFYGTSDGRIAQVSKPQVSNVRPAPEPQYEQDPSLPAGVTKQIDFAATGAQVTVERVVKKAGLVLHSDVFRSNYKPWQAIYKVGTKQ